MTGPKDMQVAFQIPEEMVKAQVQAAVASVLSQNTDSLVRSVVEMAMSQKDERSYGRETIFERIIKDQIRAVATECAKEFIDSQRGPIKALVMQKLTGSKNAKPSEIANLIVNKLCGNFDVGVDVKFHP